MSATTRQSATSGAMVRPHPAKESCRRDNEVRGRLATEQGIMFRTDSDCCIYVQMGSARCDPRVELQRQWHTHYPTTVTCSENRPKAGTMRRIALNLSTLSLRGSLGGLMV